MEKTDIRFNRATLRQQKALGPATWRDPIHGAYALVNESGQVCAMVRTLGHQMPKKLRRYSARIEGVEWWTNNTLSPTLRFLTLRGFQTAKEAMQAVDDARAIIMASTEEDACW